MSKLSLKFLKEFADTVKSECPVCRKYIINSSKDRMSEWANIFGVEYNGEEEFEAGDYIVTSKGLPHE